MRKKAKGRSLFSTISLPTPLVEEVEKVVEEFGYWPRKTDFIRDAVIQKLETCKKKLEERRQPEEAKAAKV